MELWMWLLIVIGSIVAIVVVGKRSREHQHRPMTRDEIEREHHA